MNAAVNANEVLNAIHTLQGAGATEIYGSQKFVDLIEREQQKIVASIQDNFPTGGLKAIVIHGVLIERNDHTEGETLAANAVRYQIAEGIQIFDKTENDPSIMVSIPIPSPPEKAIVVVCSRLETGGWSVWEKTPVWDWFKATDKEDQEEQARELAEIIAGNYGVELVGDGEVGDLPMFHTFVETKGLAEAIFAVVAAAHEFKCNMELSRIK